MVQTRQIIYNLVAVDDAPKLDVRFTGLDLANYTTVEMHMKNEVTGTAVTKTVTPVGASDSELGQITWGATDLIAGRHVVEFEFTPTGGSPSFRLPRKYTVILDVRPNIG